MHVKILIFSVALLLGSTTAANKRVFGGNDAKIEDYPYQVSIRIVGFHHCGGSIISDRHILTAAHCISLPITSLFVHAGNTFLGDKGAVHAIKSANVHPEWKMDKKTSYKNDIAVITLEKPIEFNEYQQKINLPSKPVENGEKVNLTGFGYIGINPIESPEKLQVLKTSVITHEECQKSTTTKVHKEQICTLREKGFGPCNGDSGGPLAANGEVVGIVSWVDSDECADGKTEFYTNVYEYKDFIESSMNETK